MNMYYKISLYSVITRIKKFMSLVITNPPVTPVRSLRPRAEEPSNASFASPAYRRVLTPGRTATLLRTPGHDCSTVHEGNTAQKVMARIAFSLQRFSIAFSWDCITSRGRTRFNGGGTRCGAGKCEAAHAALSPTLYDDKIKRIEEHLNTTPFDKLDTISQMYITHRFTLEAEHLKALSDENPKTRLGCFQRFVRRLSLRQRKGSIADTQLEKNRNATYSNPRASNRVDCYLEKCLRIKEDELAASCSENALEPEEALVQLLTEYERLLEMAKNNLEAEQNNLQLFEKAWQELLTCQAQLSVVRDDDAYHQTWTLYLQKANTYLTLYNSRNAKHEEGVPGHNALMKHLKQHQSPYVLKMLSHQEGLSAAQAKAWLVQHIKHLCIPMDREPFAAAHLDVALRLKEVITQQSQLPNTRQELHAFVKSTLGIQNSQGAVITPSKEQMATMITELLLQNSAPRPARRALISPN